MKHTATYHKLVILPLKKMVMSLLIVLFLVNQFLIGQASAMMGLMPGGFMNMGNMFGMKAEAAMIMAPKLNPDGVTTSLVEQPTITALPANPNTGDAVADARTVMIPTGKPFYAPGDISFDDPINAQKQWGAYEDSITLSGGLMDRYNQIIATFTCNYCCGSPTQVTTVNRCGCQHAKAWRGFFKYMLQTYGDKYSNDQLKGEAYRWTGIWYPKGVLADYLLATGKSNALPHETHGGAGTDGNHGIK